ncbi:hypothetical protein FK004_02670 [Flavobacterium kingsejongi]|uniref:TonB-dependent receptor n=2 Tax=Flavobacterium kingsejongi TaxID=1678728 RepID=A0A2S1LUB1_9FLAO|nr:hypothetical protein FK004_02670 [Flavobacterium kingsejongi]
MGFTGVIQAQDTVLKGRITDEKNNPLPGTHIHAGKQLTETDANGNYSIPGLPSGPLDIEISYVGYSTITARLTMESTTVYDAKMQPEVAQLNAVVIKDTRLKSNETIPGQQLKGAVIEKYSGAALGDLLKEVSGVSSLKTGSTVVKPVINGLHSSRVLIVNNNVKMEDQEWGAEHAPNFDVNSAGSINVIKGASGLQYGGNAVGGVVVIEPQHIPVGDTLFGKTIINAQSNGRGGSISSSLMKGYKSGWNWSVLGTFKYLGDFQSPDYVLSNTGTRERNFTGGFGYKGQDYGFSGYYSYFNAAIGIARASHIGNISDLVRAINSQQPAYSNDFSYNINYPKQEIQHHLAKINFYKNFSGFGKLTAQYAFQMNERLEYDIRRGTNVDNAALDLNLKTHTANIDFETEANSNYLLKVGINGSSQVNFPDPATNVRPLIPDYTKVDFGSYAIGSYNANDNLILEAGIRYDYSNINAKKYYQKSRWTERGYDADFGNLIIGEANNQWLVNPKFTYNNFSGSLGAKYKINDQLDLFANASLASRNPNPSELFSDGLHHATGNIELGDLRLTKENAMKVSLTLSRKSDAFSFDINPYLNSIQNFTVLQPTTIEYTNRGAFPVWEYSQTNARLMGVDINTRWTYSEHFSQQSMFAYVYGKDLDNSKPLIDMPPANWTNTLIYQKNDWHNLVLSLRSESVFTQKRFPNNDFYADVITDGVSVPTLVRISQPPKGYTLLHFNSEIRFKTFEKTSISIGFNIQNIFNTNYRDYLNRQRLYTDEIGRNFALQLKFNY